MQLVFDWILVKGVEMQFTAFKDGFNSVFPVHYVSTFHPDEVCMCLNKCVRTVY